MWFCLNATEDWWKILLTLYLCYLAFEVIQVLATAYYSNDIRRDLVICAAFALVPFYQLILLGVRLVATTEEIFFRTSYDDNYVPARIRTATWHW